MKISLQVDILSHVKMVSLLEEVPESVSSAHLEVWLTGDILPHILCHSPVELVRPWVLVGGVMHLISLRTRLLCG